MTSAPEIEKPGTRKGGEKTRNDAGDDSRVPKRNGDSYSWMKLDTPARIEQIGLHDLLCQVLLAELQLELQPRLAFFHGGKLVAPSAECNARDAQFLGFVSQHDRCLRWVNSIAGFGIRVDEDRSFAFVHESQSEFLGPSRLHDANHDGGA